VRVCWGAKVCVRVGVQVRRRPCIISYDSYDEAAHPDRLMPIISGISEPLRRSHVPAMLTQCRLRSPHLPTRRTAPWLRCPVFSVYPASPMSAVTSSMESLTAPTCVCVCARAYVRACVYVCECVRHSDLPHRALDGACSRPHRGRGRAPGGG